MAAETSPEPTLAERQAQWGERIRQIRRDKGISYKQIIAAMDAEGIRWAVDTITSVQLGRGRTLRPDEALILARLFGVTYHDLIGVPAPKDTPPARRGRPRLGEFDPENGVGLANGAQSDAFSRFVAAPGQKQRFARLMEQTGVKQADLMRRLIEIGLDTLEHHTEETKS